MRRHSLVSTAKPPLPAILPLALKLFFSSHHGPTCPCLPVAGSFLGERRCPDPSSSTGKPQQLALFLVMTPLTGRWPSSVFAAGRGAAIHPRPLEQTSVLPDGTKETTNC